MKAMFKIFQLFEVSIKDANDDRTYTSIVSTEYAGASLSYEEAVAKVAELIKEDASKVFQINKVFTGDINSNNTFLF